LGLSRAGREPGFQPEAPPAGQSLSSARTPGAWPKLHPEGDPRQEGLGAQTFERFQTAFATVAWPKLLIVDHVLAARNASNINARLAGVLSGATLG